MAVSAPNAMHRCALDRLRARQTACLLIYQWTCADRSGESRFHDRSLWRLSPDPFGRTNRLRTAHWANTVEAARTHAETPTGLRLATRSAAVGLRATAADSLQRAPEGQQDGPPGQKRAYRRPHNAASRRLPLRYNHVRRRGAANIGSRQETTRDHGDTGTAYGIPAVLYDAVPET